MDSLKLLIKEWLLKVEIINETVAKLYINKQEYFLIFKKQVKPIEGSLMSVYSSDEEVTVLFNDETKKARFIRTDLLFKRIECYQTKKERLEKI